MREIGERPQDIKDMKRDRGITTNIPHIATTEDPHNMSEHHKMDGKKCFGKIIRKIIMGIIIGRDLPTIRERTEGSHTTRAITEAHPYENRGCPHESYGQRARSPEYHHECRDGDHRGPPPQGLHRPYERSPIPTYNYYAPLSNRPDEDRSDGYHHSDTDYIRSFFRERQRELPTKEYGEIRNTRKSPERREDAEKARENKRKRE